MRAFTVTRNGQEPTTVFFKDDPRLDISRVYQHLFRTGEYPEPFEVKERPVTPQDAGLVHAINTPTPSEIAAGLSREAHKP